MKKSAPAAAMTIDRKAPEMVKRGKAFRDLGERECRYAFGSPTERPRWFCAEAVTLGSPYCPEHDRVCHGPIVRIARVEKTSGTEDTLAARADVYRPGAGLRF